MFPGMLSAACKILKQIQKNFTQINLEEKKRKRQKSWEMLCYFVTNGIKSFTLPGCKIVPHFLNDINN